MNKAQDSNQKYLKSMKEEGFVLITALMVIFLILTIVSTVALVTASDMKTSARARAIIKTRFVAESVSDTIFARIAGLKNGFIVEAKAWGIVDLATPQAGNNPLVGSSPTDSWGTWFALDETGKLKDCSQVKEICFRAQIRQVSSTPIVSINSREEIAVDLVVRGGCYGTDITNPQNCIYRQFQTRYRTRSYIDTVAIANTERSQLPGIPRDPADISKPLRVALLPSDEASGGFQTNDTQGYLFCGNVTTGPSGKLKDLRYNEAGSDLQVLSLPNPSCTYGGSGPTASPEREQFLPGQLSNQGITNVTNTESIFKALAGTNFTYPPASSTGLSFSPTGISINSGIEIPYPSNGVIYSEGSITINPSSSLPTDTSTFQRPITIYAVGDVTINSNIIAVGDSLVGIASQRDIIINCNAGSRCPDRRIDAVLNASRRINNNSWNNSPTGATAPILTINGSLISNERAVFGAYFSDSTATLVHGWKKTLVFDNRLLDNQPPFFFRTSQASVVRSSMDEDRCTVTSICP